MTTTTTSQEGVEVSNPDTSTDNTQPADVKSPPDGGTANGFDASKLTPEQIEQVLSMRKEKVKINGKEKELSYQELKRLASIQEAANERFEQGKRAQREAEEFKKLLDSGDLVKLYKSQGKSSAEIKELLTQRVLDILEEEEQDPRERLIKEYEAKEKAAKEAEEAKQKEEMTKKEREAYAKELERHEVELINAMKGSNLPSNDPVFYKMVVQEMLASEIAGVEMSANEAVAIVEEQVIGQLTALLPKLGIEKIKQVLGKDFIKSLREESVAEVKKGAAPFTKPQAVKQEPPSKEKDTRVPIDEFFRKMREGSR